MTNDILYMREYMAEYRKKNKEIIAKADKKWREKNKEHRKIYMKEYRKRKKLQIEA